MGGRKPPPQKKGPEYYIGLRDDYKEFILDNELLLLPFIMEAVTARTISLLMADVKSRKFMAVCREAMEETLKALNTGTNVIQCHVEHPIGNGRGGEDISWEYPHHQDAEAPD